jgi:hypothetical protein
VKPGIMGQGQSRWRWRAALAAVSVLCGLWGLALLQHSTAHASANDCAPAPACVILIQVDGLEPKDVTPASTPFLWALAHPQLQGQSATGTPLDNRAGFIWQAPRASMSTGTASTTASLLTGGYPEKSGIPSDDFIQPGPGTGQEQRLGAGGVGDNTGDPKSDPPLSPDGAEPIQPPAVDTLLTAVNSSGGKAAAFLGDPALASVTDAAAQASPYWFPPGTSLASASKADQQYTGDPRLCPIPRYPDEGKPSSPPSQETENPQNCPANDFTTMNKAFSDLQDSTYANVNFTYVELAELGAAKRMDGDPVVDGQDVPTPAHALADTDAAIASFVGQYTQNSNLAQKWAHTVLMVVGSHGYQTTPLAKRVPDPENANDPSKDLSDWVGRQGSLKLVPQGTMATIYYTGSDASKRASTLASIKDELENGPVNAACDPTGKDPCIDHVYYVDPKDASDPQQTVAGKFPSWHLDATDDKGNRTGASGDLVVTLNRGWATGRAVGNPAALQTNTPPFSNPYTGSAGGPQERAVAALIDGPSQSGALGGNQAVRSVDSLAPGGSANGLPYYPVSTGSVDPSDPSHPPSAADPKCPDSPTDPNGLNCANRPADVVDDANAPGHEAQPETVDFVPTIQALMQLSFDTADQLQGRYLQEAFIDKLSVRCDDCEAQQVAIEEPPPPPPPPPPPVEVIQPKGFDFYGLVRDLTARVVDSRDRPYSKARPGALMSTIRLEGDFGKPKAAVTLTFYRAGGAARSSRLHLKSIARFDPFVVKRGHVKIRLKIPPLFKPTYIGVTVREVASGGSGQGHAATVPCSSIKTRKPVKFQCTGPARGLLVPIADATRLNKRKGAARGGRH